MTTGPDPAAAARARELYAIVRLLDSLGETDAARAVQRVATPYWIAGVYGWDRVERMVERLAARAAA